MIIQTLGTVNSNGNTDYTIDTENYNSHPEAVVQVDITGTITVQLLGSLDGTNFHEIKAAATTGYLQPIAMVPYLRITASGTAGGSAVIKLGRGGVT